MHKSLEMLLPKIVSDPDLHGRWLNTFSYLEYIGFRKIVKSQTAENLDVETLGHAVEESRHALLLKKLAIQIGGSKFKKYSPSALLCGQQAEFYFQLLDRTCENHIEPASENKARLTYLYVTWLVELRALSVYRLYQNALEAVGVKPSLTGLLAEEDKHLADVEQELLKSDPDFHSRGLALRRVEDELYQAYLLALNHELNASEESIAAHA